MRPTITIVLLAVLALRSLVPTGYMAQAANGANGPPGALEIVICTGTGPAVLTLDPDGKTVPKKSQHLDHNVCPFAAAGAAAVAAAEPKSLAGEAEYASVAYTLAVAQFSETPKPGATSARGPPSRLT
jgi:hypothetical protein